MVDYRGMWKSLGLNVEKHDQLLEVLPKVFGDLFLSQQNRPLRMAYFDQFAGDIHGFRIRELLEHKAKGGKVFGAFCIYVPEEVVYAATGACVGLCGGRGGDDGSCCRKASAEEPLSPHKVFGGIQAGKALPLHRGCRPIVGGDHM